MLPAVCILAFSAGLTMAMPERRDTELSTCITRIFGSNAAQRIVGPEDPTYQDARMGEPIQFDQLPALITFPQRESEVGALIKCAVAAGVKPVPRAGGHHFLAYSSLADSLVIDLSHMDHVEVAEDKMTARVGAGIRLGPLYTALGLHGRTWTGGICPTVGLSGFLGAGGFNMQMRQLGLGVDNVLAARIVTADGCIVDASPDHNADLFWAVRGGGGGMYGIVIEWTLKVHEFPRSAMLMLRWNAPEPRVDVAERFFKWGPKADQRLMTQVNIRKNRTEVQGWCLGCSADELQAMVGKSGLLEIGEPDVHITGGCSTHNSRLIGLVVDDCIDDDEANAVAPLLLNHVQQPYTQVSNFSQYRYDQSRQDPNAQAALPWNRFIRISKSFFLQREEDLTRDMIQDLVDRITELPEEAAGWGEWHSWNLTTKGDAAFPWRNRAYAHLQFIVAGSPDETKQQGYVDWSDRLESYLRPKLGAASYAGYMDSRLSVSPHESYHGDNYEKLQAIKQRYDPKNLFTHPQAIEAN